MSRSSSISQPIPTDKDPPHSPPPTSSQRRPSNTQRPPSYSSSPKDQNKSMPPPPRPSINTRTTSFDPNPHILNPSPIRSPNPDLSAQIASQSLTATSQQQQQQHQPEQELRSRNLTPFFTLVNDVGNENGTGGGTYHPSRVHYIFSDDDASELLTSAILRAQQQNAHPAGDDEEDLQGEDVSPEDDTEVLSRGSLDRSSSDRPTTGTTTNTTTTTTSSSSSATFRRDDEVGGRGKSRPKKGDKLRMKQKPTQAGKQQPQEREERIILVDVNDSLDGVEKITSLSRDWQVLSASIDHAPSFDPRGSGGGGGGGGDVDDEDDEKGLMLRIEGVGVSSLRDEEGEKAGRVRGLGLEGSGHVGGRGVMGEEEMQALMETFDRKMAVLRRVVGTASVAGGVSGGQQQQQQTRGEE